MPNKERYWKEKNAKIAKRVADLEKAIMTAIDKYGIKLKSANYVDIPYMTNDICGCAIGCAILSTAKNKKELMKLVHNTKGDSWRDIGDKALEIVNDGITKQDLIDLEAGFEGYNEGNIAFSGVFQEYDDRKTLNKYSPFYHAGVKLRTRMLKELKEKENEGKTQ